VGDTRGGGWLDGWKEEVVEVLDRTYHNYRYWCYRITYTRTRELKGHEWVHRGTGTFDSRPADTDTVRYRNVSRTTEPVYGWVYKETREFVGEPRDGAGYRYRNKSLVRYEVWGRVDRLEVSHRYRVTHSPGPWPAASLTVTLENRNGYGGPAYLEVSAPPGIVPSLALARVEFGSPVEVPLALRPAFSTGPGTYAVELRAYDAGGRLVAAENYTLRLSSERPPDRTRTETEVATRPAWENYVALVITVGEGEGTTSPPPGVHLYPAGTRVELSALPASGYAFSRWELDNGDVIQEQSFGLTLNRDIEVRACFERFGPAREVSKWYTVMWIYGDEPDRPVDVTTGYQAYGRGWYLVDLELNLCVPLEVGGWSPSWTEGYSLDEAVALLSQHTGRPLAEVSIGTYQVGGAQGVLGPTEVKVYEMGETGEQITWKP
jgi:hypothetical protein